MHDGHRQRLKQTFLDNGLSGFYDHNILELLLFYTIPRRDTNELAHILINTFGSLSAVFDAPYEELLKIDGIGENTASLIKLITPLYGKYLEDKVSNGTIIDSTDAAGQYLTAKYIGVTNETSMLLCIDNKGRVINCDTISTGSIKMTEITSRKVVEIAIKNNASSVILAHNHPGGIAVPSSADVEVTRSLTKMLYSIDVKLKDHIIIADNEYFSMVESPKFSLIFF
ncbi:MAG: DNA repair protein RadC [Oscillospiraceae bacterium]